MRLSQIFFISLLGLAAASPAPGGLDGSAVVSADDFKPDWNAFESDYKLALEKSKTDPSLTKRLNTQSASNVAFGQAIYAAGSAAANQVKSLSHWNKVLNIVLFVLLPGFALLLLLLPFYVTKLTTSSRPGSNSSS